MATVCEWACVTFRDVRRGKGKPGRRNLKRLTASIEFPPLWISVNEEAIAPWRNNPNQLFRSVPGFGV